MSSMSLAISFGGGARPAYPGYGTVLPYADPRAIGSPTRPPEVTAPGSNDIASLSETVRDRVTLSTRVRQSPRADRAAPRKQPLAQPVTRNVPSWTLSEMADQVEDRVTLSRAQQETIAQPSTYSRTGASAAKMQTETSLRLEALATEVTDQVTLTAEASDQETTAPEITIFLGGNGRIGSSRMAFPSFNGLMPVPSAG